MSETLFPEATQPEPSRLDKCLAAEPNQGIVTSFAGGFAAVMTTEYVRAALVNPESSTSTRVAQAAQSEDLPESEKPEPIILQEDVPAIVYEPLQHGGDFFDGYIYTAALFGAFAAVRIKQLTNKARVLAAAAATTAGVAYHELLAGKPDPADIPAGVLGAAVVVGLVHLFSEDGSGRKPKRPNRAYTRSTT